VYVDLEKRIFAVDRESRFIQTCLSVDVQQTYIIRLARRRAERLSEQFAFFEDFVLEPDGLRYAAEFVSPEAERKLISRIQDLPLEPFEFGQFEGKRRVASFGFRYDYASRQLRRSEPIPTWLHGIIAKIEAFDGPDTHI
jgi:hypothetical protein